MSFAQHMVSSLRHNDRRKPKHIPFEKKDETKKGTPIKTKKYGVVEKHEVKKILKQKREGESQIRNIKIVLTIGITLISVIIIYALIELVFG